MGRLKKNKNHPEQSIFHEDKYRQPKKLPFSGLPKINEKFFTL
jgi:hypothetical protein